MCGIAGALMWKERLPEPVWSERLQHMIATLHHRGPDDRGHWSAGRVGLAHARLAILDLTHAGHQPMVSEDEKVVVVFNGEIYNFSELRAELIGRGYRFGSGSDTEVLLHGYRAWGRGLMRRLNGMFAFALWDEDKKELILARDRFGEKPLYYFQDADKFVFGSEIKALFPFSGVPRAPGYEAIHHYLTYQYVPSPWTAFEGIRKLPPGHMLVCKRGASEPMFERYWALPTPSQSRCRPVDEEELAWEFRTRFQTAVQRRMIADVPLGAFLSGGVDSSAVVAAMAHVSDRPIKTFSIGFEKDEYDETRYARMVAECYGTEHHEEVVRPDALSILPKLVWHYGEPFSDPSAIPTFHVAELARRHVTVALSGDGGDELFLGYSRYQSLYEVDGGALAIRRLQAAMLRASDWLPERLRRRRLLGGVRNRLRDAARSRAERYSPYLVYFSDTDKRTAYAERMQSPGYRSSLSIIEPYLDEIAHPALAAGWADAHTYLPDDILVKVDVASMAYSLESRAPFLDPEFAEWAMTVPLEQKFRPGESKRLMKRALEPWLPGEILHRKKMGFGVPIDHWLCAELRELVHDLLLSKRFSERGIAHPEYVEMMLEEHCGGVRQHHTRLWGLLMLELWFRMWIDGEGAMGVMEAA